MNRDWVNQKACRPSHHIYIIAYAFISHDEIDQKILVPYNFFDILYTTSHHKIQVPTSLVAKVRKPICDIVFCIHSDVLCPVFKTGDFCVLTFVF